MRWRTPLRTIVAVLALCAAGGGSALSQEERRASLPAEAEMPSEAKSDSAAMRWRLEADASAVEAKGMADAGHLASAASLYAAALVRYEKLGDLEGRAAALTGLADARYRLGDFAKADSFYRRALAATRELGDLEGTAAALHALGSIAGIRGRCSEALSLEGEAMAIYENLGDRRGSAETIRGMASVHLSLGDNEGALELYDRAFAMAVGLGDGAFSSLIADDIHAVYAAAGRLDLAIPFYEGYLAHARRADDRDGVVRALTSVGSLAMDRGERAKARRLAEEALQSLPERGRNHLRAPALYLLSRTETGETSTERLERALALADSAGLEDIKWQCLSDLGERALDAGDTARAFSYQHRAIVTVESLKRLVSSGVPWGHSLAPVVRPYERIVRLLLMRGGGSAEIKEALSYVERCRAQRLAMLLREAMARSEARGESRVLEEEREILSRLSYYQSRLRSGFLDEAERAEVMEGIGEVEERFSRLSVRFENGGRPHAAELYPRIEQMDELLGTIVPGEHMLSYFLGEDRSFLFSATEGVFEVFELPPRPAIEERVEAFLGLLEQISREKTGTERPPTGVPPIPSEVFHFASRSLFDLLLGPVGKRLVPGQTFVVIPDGVLDRLPFALLENREGEYLVEKHDISYAPSLKTLKYLRDRERVRLRSTHRSSYDIIAIGARGEDVGRSARGEICYPCTAIPIEPLAGAGEDARMVGALFERSLVLARRGARESVVRDSPLFDAAIVHFAARAHLDGADPRRSFIVLDPERSFADTTAVPSEDGILWWHEAASLGFGAAIVALPCCRFGQGESGGGGLTGFAEAFLNAGAGTVLAAQLESPAGFAEEMMEQYYAGLRRGKTSAAALAAAQRAGLEREGEFSRPALWCSFCVIGDGAARPELSSGFDPTTWISILILIVAGGAFVWGLFGRRRIDG